MRPTSGNVLNIVSNIINLVHVCADCNPTELLKTFKIRELIIAP